MHASEEFSQLVKPAQALNLCHLDVAAQKKLWSPSGGSMAACQSVLLCARLQSRHDADTCKRPQMKQQAGKVEPSNQLTTAAVPCARLPGE
eukprot:1149313-Pelagomonas_calceolata.AAC.3